MVDTGLGMCSRHNPHRTLADLCSLNGNIHTGAFLSSHACLDLTSPETFAVTKISFLYKQLEPEKIKDTHAN